MREAGVTIGVGTDLVMDWFRYLPNAYIEELQQYEKAGFSTTETLEAATRVNAEILDMGEQLGTLEPGKLADLLVVEGQPDRELNDLKNVELVLRDGHTVLKNGQVITEPHEARERPGKKDDAVAGQWT
jgi:imidazolonepropionase-like amidohydrolase